MRQNRVVKAAQISPYAPEWTDQRAANAPTQAELEQLIRGLVDYIVSTRERIGLQQQQLERASGLAKGSLSNIEGRGGSIRLETFVRIAHGLGMQPSQLATLLDQPYRAPLALGRDVPVVVGQGVDPGIVVSVAAEADAIATKRASVRKLATRAKAKVAGAKKDRDR